MAASTLFRLQPTVTRTSQLFTRLRLLQSPERSTKISTSCCCYLKQIMRKEEGNNIVIEAVKVPSERSGKVVKTPVERGKCPLCRVGVTHLKHTDILILSQFINSDGTVIPQNVTGLCSKQQFRVVRAVALAQRAGLLPKKPGTPIFGGWEKWNTYFKKF